jgi:hypothetical protein
MNPIIRNILAVIAGLIAGGVVNIELVNLGPILVPMPAGADVTTIEGLKASMHLMKPINFLMPFLAHALGTLAGAYLAALIASGHKMKFALGIGFFFLAGGITGVIMYPSPMWFNVLDLVVAYLPMAYLAGRLAEKLPVTQ